MSLTTKDIDFLIKNGQTVKKAAFTLRFEKDYQGPNFNIAVIVPKKIAPKAITRNRIRRRIKAVLAKTNPEVKPKKAIIFVYDSLEKMKFLELVSALNSLFLASKPSLKNLSK